MTYTEHFFDKALGRAFVCMHIGYRLCSDRNVHNKTGNVGPTYNVTLWRIAWQFFGGNTKIYVVVELRVTVKYIKILSVAQLCFCRKFVSPAAVPVIRTSFF